MYLKSLTSKGILAMAVFLTPFHIATAQNRSYSSCDQYLPTMRQIEGGQKVGPESCLMQEVEALFNNRVYTRVDLGLDGSAEGYLTKEGKYREYLTNAPELVFPQAQASDVQPAYLAVARYTRAKGAAIFVLYPNDRSDWNGKLWVTAHGRGVSFHDGSLNVWNDYMNMEEPIIGLNKLEQTMLAKGYAVAVTKRTSAEGLGEITATLSDGTVVDYAAFNDSHALMKDYAAIAKAVITERMGSAPTRTYLYGKSAGARLARGLNYFGQRLNVDQDGNRPVFDGFLVDDSAAGTWLPVVMKNGKDVLLTTNAEKQAFVPQLELVHQSYFNINDHDLPDFVTINFLTNKYNNARILHEKGLQDKFRMYEIRQMSHSGGEGYMDGRSPNGKVQILDLSLLMDGAIDILDSWVEDRGSIPVSRSDYSVIGDANRDGTIENPAIQYPEVACPLGKFYPYPASGAGSTAWAAFTGEGIEPMDEKDVFVDLNSNGLWDFRETPTQAWQRIGLLKRGQELTRERFVDCVRHAAEILEQDGFFSRDTVDGYVEAARTHNLTPSSDGNNALIYYSRF